MLIKRIQLIGKQIKTKNINFLLLFWQNRIRDRPIFGFYRYIGIPGVDKTLLHSSRIQTTCARKHNEASQDSYLTAKLAGAVS